MAIKKDTVTTKKVEKKIRQKILVEEGGRMNSDIPYKVIYSEFVESASEAKERVKSAMESMNFQVVK